MFVKLVKIEHFQVAVKLKQLRYTFHGKFDNFLKVKKNKKKTEHVCDQKFSLKKKPLPGLPIETLRIFYVGQLCLRIDFQSSAKKTKIFAPQTEVHIFGGCLLAFST